MQVFHCDCCGSAVYFENRQCGACGSRLGFLAEHCNLHALTPAAAADEWEIATQSGVSYRLCSNAAHDACNWIVPADSSEQLCTACRHNRTIPDLSFPENLIFWRMYELAKHRLFYTLIKLGLPTPSRAEDPDHGLAFDFLSEASAAVPVVIGHENGLIVLSLEEADDSERARRRRQLGEPYRTLLGHLRHESGHYYWDLLIKGSSLERFREIFGDERQDYDEALRTYYAAPPPDWQSHFISSYASAHPWEDFAETWAHYFHIIDTLEMARSFNLGFSLQTGKGALEFHPDRWAEFGNLMNDWFSLTVVMNSLNRCMGESDLYPFVPPPDALGRLRFIHELVGPMKPSAV